MPTFLNITQIRTDNIARRPQMICPLLLWAMTPPPPWACPAAIDQSPVPSPKTSTHATRVTIIDDHQCQNALWANTSICIRSESTTELIARRYIMGWCVQLSIAIGRVFSIGTMERWKRQMRRPKEDAASGRLSCGTWDNWLDHRLGGDIGDAWGSIAIDRDMRSGLLEGLAHDDGLF